MHQIPCVTAYIDFFADKISYFIDGSKRFNIEFINVLFPKY